MRPNYNKNTGDTYSAAEWGQLKDKNNNPGLNDAWSSVVKFDDEYYPPEQTISTNTTYTIDATNSGTGNGRCDQIIASGTPTLTFTGFTIRKSDLTVSTDTVTLVDGHTYTIVFIRRGAVSEVYINDNSGTVVPVPIPLAALTLGTAVNGDTEVTIPFTNPNSSNETINQLYYKLSTEPTTWTTGVTAASGATTFPAQTGLINDLTYDFKAVAVGDGVNYTNSADSNEVQGTPSVGTSILFQDTFAGTTIDLAKWLPTSSVDISVTQNDELIFTDLTVNGSASKGFVSSDGLFNRDVTGVVTVMKFDIDDSLITYNDAYRLITLISTDIDDFVQLARTGIRPLECDFIIKQSGTITSSIETNTLFDGSWKIVMIGGTASLYKWGGSDWGTAIASGSYDPFNGHIQISRPLNSDNSSANIWKVDDVYVTDYDFATLNP
jgi:hypothetical protein